MSNTVSLVATEFKTQLGSTFGFRMHDNYDSTYTNLESEEIMDLSDLELLALVVKGYNDSDYGSIQAFLEHIEEHECSIEINYETYSWEQIKDIF